MSLKWKTTTLYSIKDCFDILADLSGKRWLCRGHPECYKKLIPTIDRELKPGLSRTKKLDIERRSIELYRSTARYFSDTGEKTALSADITTLMTLRHYGLPTRLLDWSMSPYIAAYFAVEKSQDKDGELWAFDEPQYEIKGIEQWKNHPETTRYRDDKSFDATLTIFQLSEPEDWIVCYFYLPGFHRQSAQAGAYSLTPNFNRDHSELIAKLLGDSEYYNRFVISAKIKSELLKILYDEYGI